MTDKVKDILTIVGSIIVAIVSSGLIQYFITRHDNKKNLVKVFKEEVGLIRKDVSKVSGELQEHKATLARTHILRFADELHDGKYHSDEYFRQQILDIDTYNRYCETHPDFANGLTRMASEYIRDEYRKRFLVSEDNAS